jgi:hemolysin III
VAFFSLSGPWRPWSLLLAWTVAIASSAIAVSPLRAPRWVGAAGYIAVGWLCTLPMAQFVQALPWEGVGLFALGGVLYTVGAGVYALRRPDPLPRVLGYHEVFHLLVLAGSLCHFVAIWQYVLPVSA